MVCSAVHAFELARLTPARTAPVVGEIVSVASVAVTDETAPPPDMAVHSTPVPLVYVSACEPSAAQEGIVLALTAAVEPVQLPSIVLAAMFARPAIGSPVAFVSVPLEGVPNAPLNRTGAPAEPTFIASAVAMPVPGVMNDSAPSAPPAPELVIAEPAPIVTDEGVIAPSVKVMAGVVVALATEPETPLAVTTETVVTVPAPPVVSAVHSTPVPFV